MLYFNIRQHMHIFVIEIFIFSLTVAFLLVGFRFFFVNTMTSTKSEVTGLVT